MYAVLLYAPYHEYVHENSLIAQRSCPGRGK